jgi:hypothetical protein
MEQLETGNTAGDTYFDARHVVDRGLHRAGTRRCHRTSVTRRRRLGPDWGAACYCEHPWIPWGRRLPASAE